MKVPRLVLLTIIVVSILMPGCVSKRACLAKFGIPSAIYDTALVISRPFTIDTIIIDTIYGWQEIRHDTLRDTLISTIYRDNVASVVYIYGKELLHSLTMEDTFIPRPISIHGSSNDYIIRSVQPVEIEKKIPQFYRFTLYYFIITCAGGLLLFAIRLKW